MFRGGEMDPYDVWSRVRFLISLWASTSKNFHNYSLGNILLILR